MPQNSSSVADQSEVFSFLNDPRAFGLTAPVQRIDTHGAAIFLAGKDAYKVKRAVRFPFMDFSTLEKRRAACEAEITINQPVAPGIYIAAVPITRSAEGLALGGPGEVVEWAVHMRRFDENATLDRVAARQTLSADLVAELARVILRSHERAPLRDSEAATRALERYLDQNEEAFAADRDLFEPERARRLAQHARASLAASRELLIARGRAGYVRRCHGDLHLRNIVLVNGSEPGIIEPVLFDAIEFDDAIASGDVLYDLAFLLMDLEERGLRKSGNLLLNRYLWGSDDAQLSGLAALPILLSIRSAIRAKVIAAGLPNLRSEELDRAKEEARRYFRFAEEFLKSNHARLIAVGGLSGTGKSTLAAELAPCLGAAPGAVHLRSDIERKRLFRVAENKRLPQHAYSAKTTQDVYARLIQQASVALKAGQSVIADAVYAQPHERRAIEQLAIERGTDFTGLWLDAPLSVRLNRVRARTRDASDADADVVKAQASFDIGSLTWNILDVSGIIPDTFQRARDLIGEPSGA